MPAWVKRPEEGKVAEAQYPHEEHGGHYVDGEGYLEVERLLSLRVYIRVVVSPKQPYHKGPKDVA